MRPRVGPYWMQWLWTGLFSASLAVIFTVLGSLAFGRGEGAWHNIPGWIHWYGKNLIVCLTIGATVHLLFDLARLTFASPARLARWRPWQRSVFFAGTPLLGVTLAWPVGVWLAGQNVLVWFGSSDGRNVIAGTLLTSLLISFLLHHWFAGRAAQAEAERRATEAQLRLLQAQIEPHFLFNTLANLHGLMEHDLPRARALLERFTEHLRGSLGALRAEDGTVGDELDRVSSYLALMQLRMEDRLRYSLEADDAVRRLPLPPLLLQPLVENAVVHGLEPSIDGGTVRVSARREGDHLVLEVADDGRGLAAAPVRRATPGAGVALDNIRQRLDARHGHAARLELHDAGPGTLARITLPCEPAP
jgi:signal transduction histidine kinase